jgi:hypothetical protein
VSRRINGTAAQPDETVIDGDRSHPILGNRHLMADPNDPTERRRVIAAYQSELQMDLLTRGPKAIAIGTLAARVASGERIALRCWCAPLACHLDVVAEEVRRQARQLIEQGVRPAPAELRLCTHKSVHYAPRTEANAQAADLTVAFALDFATGGERLTRKAAGERYLGIDLRRETCPVTAARLLYRALRPLPGRQLNIAGNGLFSLAAHGWDQPRIDAFVYQVLRTVHRHLPLASIRSGGQTGADLAGLAAGVALGLHTVGLWPLGFVQRDVNGKDVRRSPASLRAQIEAAASRLRQLPDTAPVVAVAAAIPERPSPSMALAA